MRLSVLSLGLFLVACGEGFAPTEPVRAPDGGAPDHDTPYVENTMPPGFAEAVLAEDVPLEILVGIAYSETGMQMVQGEEEFEGRSPGFGVMGLRGDMIPLAAELAGLSEEEVTTDRDANIMAVAALLSEWAAEEGIDTSDLGAWAPVVARYSGIENPEGLAEYVHHEVFAAINTGVKLEGFEMDATEATADYPTPAIDEQRTGDSSAIWTRSPNQSSRGSYSPQIVVIHTCEGSYSGCWSWLTNSAAGVSAHYVVNSTGTQVRHLVDEDRKAWHISASYSCSRNDGVLCNRNGVSTNNFSIGIEHAGYGSQSSWNAGLIDRSAALTCGITERHGIPIDEYHIVGHGQLQPWNRTDPGAAWPWASYLSKVETECGGGSTPPTPPTPAPPTQPTSPTNPAPPTPAPTPGSDPTAQQFVIDSNSNANDSAWYDIDVSSSWWPSANVSNYYNTGYWVAPTYSVSDPAEFNFRASGDACYRVDAWWTAGSDRTDDAVFLGWDAAENEVGRATVNQRINGGQWNTLGTWQFSPGWNTVALSRWNNGGYVIADAVRLTPATCN